jgi:hypothetical protein
MDRRAIPDGQQTITGHMEHRLEELDAMRPFSDSPAEP